MADSPLRARAIRARTIRASDLEFGILEAGPAAGPLALCLHGFPGSAHTWRHLLPELAGAGFHAVAPFLRGYAPTGIPADGEYGIGALAADAIALHEALGAPRLARRRDRAGRSLPAPGAAGRDPRAYSRLDRVMLARRSGRGGQWAGR